MKIEGKSGTCAIAVGEKISRLRNYTGSGSLAIITDSTVRRIHGKLFPEAEVIEIGIGEGAKTLSTVNGIYMKFLEIEADRSFFVVGIGGGIVCDVAGFAASTYIRGLRCGFVPTTLIAQADAAVGGKNGVNLEGYKNLIGTIRQPEFVLCDISLLSTLPLRELRCGFAEIIKAGCIADAKLFTFLEENSAATLSLKQTAIEKAMHDALAVKVGIVSRDENEKGERMKLNFGHTLGHAIEKACLLPHGEAISIGMACAARISCEKGMLSSEEAARIEKLLGIFRLPTRLADGKEKLMDAIKKDKKRFGGKVKMALLEGIGNAKLCDVSFSELEGVFDDLH